MATKSLKDARNAYMQANANMQEINKKIDEIEKKYISDNCITNSDGSIPDYIWLIDSDEGFEQSCDELNEIIESSGLNEKWDATHQALTEAEFQPIDASLSNIAEGARALIFSDIVTNDDLRQELIDKALLPDDSADVNELYKCINDFKHLIKTLERKIQKLTA